jgi:hypothetical protein
MALVLAGDSAAGSSDEGKTGTETPRSEGSWGGTRGRGALSDPDGDKP